MCLCYHLDNLSKHISALKLLFNTVLTLPKPTLSLSNHPSGRITHFCQDLRPLSSPTPETTKETPKSHQSGVKS